MRSLILAVVVGLAAGVMAPHQAEAALTCESGCSNSECTYNSKGTAKIDWDCPAVRCSGCSTWAGKAWAELYFRSSNNRIEAREKYYTTARPSGAWISTYSGYIWIDDHSGSHVAGGTTTCPVTSTHQASCPNDSTVWITSKSGCTLNTYFRVQSGFAYAKQGPNLGGTVLVFTYLGPYVKASSCG